MASSQLELLASRRLLPLFVTQFLSAINDNLLKTALVTFVTYRAVSDPETTKVVVALAGVVFIFPYFPFSATAGQLADKFEKSGLIRWIKLWEIGVMILAAVGFAFSGMGFILFELGVLFLLGTQSTFFGPVKYGILPDHLATEELMTGNALIESGTFLAILLGTIAGGIMGARANAAIEVSAVLIAIAVSGWIASFFLPPARRAAPELSVNPNIFAETLAIVRHATQRRDLRLSIIAISWFWLVGSVFLFQFPTYAKETLRADAGVQTLFLTMFSIGIGVGAFTVGRLLRGEVSARLAPLGALGMAAFTVDLYFASYSAVGGSEAELIGFIGFLGHLANWRVAIDLFGIAFSGGLFTVPLYAILQARSDEAHRSRVVAANNIVNAVFMSGAGLLSAVLLAVGVPVVTIFLAVGIANVAAAVVVNRIVPGELLKMALAFLVRRIYRIEVRGLENYRSAGERAVIIVNHLSFIDGAILAAMLPGRPAFAVASSIAERWWAQPFLRLVDAVPIESGKPMATKTLIRAVEAGKRCVIFPEGRITVTGALMKVYEGPGMIADKAGAAILPLRLDGLQYTRFSRLKGKLRLRAFPKVTITILEPRRLRLDETLRGRARRRRMGLELYDLMSSLIFETAGTPCGLFEALLAARDLHGRKQVAVEDVERRPLNYGRLAAASMTLARALVPGTHRGERVGVLLPSSVGAIVTFFALQSMARVPAMLNFSTGANAMRAGLGLAQIRAVVTSRRFVAAARMEAAVAELAQDARIVYLEDLRAAIGVIERLRGLLAARFARWRKRSELPAPDDPAVVLFTSGTEGMPKGVVLSHANILANCRQLAARVDFTPSDVIFNALPIFHSFGLTAGLLLPLVNGVRVFLYPSPLHYRVVPELVYDANATIFFGTDTFLRGYARAANAYDFYSVRYVFAGAERVREETRRTWIEKFGLRLLEGYGATETAPVIATNTPMHYKAGTVGRLLPGIRHRLEEIEGVAGARLFVAGPNVMLGYCIPDRPGELVAPPDGWYDTGDIVAVDDEGYIRILDRAKRFAKIAGEMVSLGAVEALAQSLWPEARHAALALPDARKGEQVILITDATGASVDAVLAAARERAIPELLVPRRVVIVPTVPALPTGKADYRAARVIAEAELQRISE